ncbi:MAG: molybdenum ABC transporter ATP-binding protein, partial [Terriglobales bacterium]
MAIAVKSKPAPADEPATLLPPAMSQSESSLSVQIEKKLSSRGAPDFLLDAQFSVPAGITILFGPSGSGKTTILQCIAGLLEPDAGRIAAGGRLFFDSAQRCSLGPAHRSVGYVFQGLALFPHLTVEQNAEYGLNRLPRERRRARTQAALESFHIAPLAKKRPDDLSGGERQRVALARALVTDPCVLLLDEPLAALDHATKTRIIEDLRVWNASHRIPILYVTHARREVFALGERVLFLEHGRLTGQGTTEAIAQIAGFENLLTATVAALHPEYGTMTCCVGASVLELEVPLGAMRPGEPVALAIRAGDILLSRTAPEGLSARNIIRGK